VTENPPQSSTSSLPRMYTDLAQWWPLISSPNDYEDEATYFKEILLETSNKPPLKMLELGSGGGNNASYLKKHFQMTLVDLSPQMLEVSRLLNPECRHIQGDMRSVELGELFDAVFVHDAVMYMTSLRDLNRVIETAYVHSREEGVVLFVPDFVRETFEPNTKHGGHDGVGRAARYIEWIYDPDPADTTYIMDFAYLLKTEPDQMQSIYDRHVMGLFNQNDWLNALNSAGFDPKVMDDPYGRLVFTGVKCGV
jgi:SAM-dependent methyltransferase